MRGNGVRHMEITKIVPLVQAKTGWREFELQLDSGRCVYVHSNDLLRYRKVQEAVLQKTGRIFAHEPAESRGGTAAWHAYVMSLLSEEVTIPEYEQRSVGGHAVACLVYSLERWRREHREAEAVSA
jgi:hypothetical protein